MNKYLFLLLLGTNSLIYAQDTLKFNNLYGAYLGQTPPGNIPEIFAPGIISIDTTSETGISFSPDGKECYYSSDSKIYYTRQDSGNWTLPVIVNFVSDSGGENPMISPDGRFFTFSRNNDIFICHRIGEVWSDPEAFPYPINTDKRESGHSVTLDSTLYFTSNNRSEIITRGDIYCTGYLKNHTDTAYKIDVLNTNDDEDGVYVAPDESYIIFWSWRPDCYGMHDLYISYKDSTGNWTIPQNMGETINTDELEVLCSVSPDGEYLFFVRGSSLEEFDIYWVDTSIIELLRPNTPSAATNATKNIMNNLKYYPNPFNSKVTIQYNIPGSSFVALKTYNSIGQEIETLVNDFQTAGEHKITWKPKGLPDGIYFYRLQLDNYIIETKKMLLLN